MGTVSVVHRWALFVNLIMILQRTEPVLIGQPNDRFSTKIPSAAVVFKSPKMSFDRSIALVCLQHVRNFTIFNTEPKRFL